MLLSTKKEPFNSDDYIFEVKWDGYRCISFINDSNVFLQSKNKKNLSTYFPELQEIYQAIKCEKAVLDGEICCLDLMGKPNFSKLQKRIRSKKRNIKNSVKLIVWDILSYNNKDVYQRPLVERKEILRDISNERNGVIIPGYIHEQGKKLYSEAENNKLEGIVAKKLDSPYEFKRSKYWYKIKCWQYTTSIIGGYSIDGNSLLVGKSLDNKLIYMGKVKMSLDDNMKKALISYLPLIEIKESPFCINRQFDNINWVKPLINTVIRYTEISKNNTFRHGFAVKILLEQEEK